MKRIVTEITLIYQVGPQTTFSPTAPIRAAYILK